MPTATLKDLPAAAGRVGHALMRLPRTVVQVGTAPLLGRVPDTTAPSGALCRERYGKAAEAYDSATAAWNAYRRQAVNRLAPLPGDVVLDAGCGTGLNLPLLRGPIGAAGLLVGVDLSPEMLTRARERSEREGWRNVVLVESAAEDVMIPLQADAVLLCGTHDILRSRPALENILRHVRPGGRIVAAGPKWAPWWWPTAPALNLCTWQLNRAYVTTFEGFDRPWSHLARLVPGLQVADTFYGAGYIAVGQVDGAPASGR